MISTPLRRSARIAARNTIKVPLAPVNTPRRMKDVFMDMEEFLEFAADTDATPCKKGMQLLAFQNQLHFLLNRRYLAGFFENEDREHLQCQLDDFHESYNTYIHQFKYPNRIGNATYNNRKKYIMKAVCTPLENDVVYQAFVSMLDIVKKTEELLMEDNSE